MVAVWNDPVVITGVGLLGSVGSDRESTWQAIREGRSGARRLSGLRAIPDGLLLGATVEGFEPLEGRLKVLPMYERVAAEALSDARLDLDQLDRDRVGCFLAAHMGDSRFYDQVWGKCDDSAFAQNPWWNQWLPNSACSLIAGKYRLGGPQLCHSPACASGLVEVLAATRAILDGQCDAALAGAAEAIDPLFAAGFHKMRVLAQHEVPEQACRPYDRHRTGFVLGEGAGMFLLERLSHARRRGARIYAEIAAGKMLAEAHHVTGLNSNCETLTRLLTDTLDAAQLDSRDIGYINSHGTGTEQNDLMEMKAIGRVFEGADYCVSSTKPTLGHVLNAAGCVELATTVLAMRDGFAPPTLNLTDPDPQCQMDCVPLVGRANRFQHALKISVAFGGHLVAIALRRWNGAQGYAYPSLAPPAAGKAA